MSCKNSKKSKFVLPDEFNYIKKFVARYVITML